MLNVNPVSTLRSGGETHYRYTGLGIYYEYSIKKCFLELWQSVRTLSPATLRSEVGLLFLSPSSPVQLRNDGKRPEVYVRPRTTGRAVSEMKNSRQLLGMGLKASFAEIVGKAVILKNQPKTENHREYT